MTRSVPELDESPTDLSEAIAYAVYELVHQWDAFDEERAQQFGLSGAQAAVLMNLLHEEPSMRELADWLECDASNITGLVTRLERRELVQRVADPDDARVHRVQLTAAGERLARRMRSRFFQGSPSVAGLSYADQRALLTLLQRAVDGGAAQDR
jgi:DNA-binding MarR family transcriptional regulator